MNLDFAEKRDEMMWTGIGLASAVVGGIAVRNLIKAGWNAYYDEHPPVNPASPDTGWVPATVFTALMGAGVGVARMLSRRAAAEGWKKVAGAYPAKMMQRRNG